MTETDRRTEGMDALRRRIDELDETLVRLLNERARCALAIGELKRELGLQIYQPEREREVLSRVRAASAGPLDGGAVTRLFERIIDEARRLERLASAESGGHATMGDAPTSTAGKADPGPRGAGAGHPSSEESDHGCSDGRARE